MRVGKIKEFLENNNLPAFRLKQIIKAVYEDSVSLFTEITTLSKDLREKLDDEIEILSFEVVEVLKSKNKDSFKALLKLSDGNYIETVLLKVMPGHLSACISSQAGCPMGCKFCATGKNGFKRNLTSEEITDQVLFWRQYIKKNNMEGQFSNIVVMGMGEPFMNYDNLKQALHNLTDEQTFNLASRHISVSTSGLVDGIKKFSHDFPQINLAVSLIVANNEKRDELMPVNHKFSLRELKNAIDMYIDTTNRKVFLEYVMFAGVNDNQSDARNLIEFIESSNRSDLLHVNLIRYNEATLDFKPSPKDTVKWFKQYLENRGINVTIRKSLGQEIKAACGQLAGK